MDARNRRAREIQDAIRVVLLSEWDPIGCDVPRDEYDEYIGGVYSLLSQGASVADIAEHLASIEMGGNGLDVSAQSLHEVAVKLRKIDVDLGSDRAK